MKRSPSRYTAITHPIDLPSGPYRIFGADPFTMLLTGAIGKIRPAAVFVGLMPDDAPIPEPAGDEAVLVTDADWVRRAEMLSGAGWAAERIIVMPFPADCPNNGFATFVTDCSDKCAFDGEWTPDRQVQLPRDVAVSMLFRDGHARISGTEIGIAPALFPPLHEPNRLAAAAKDIETVVSALADAQSRSAYLSVLRDPPQKRTEAFVNTMMRGQQYFEYARVTPGDTVLNFGVFDGFELPFFISQMDGQGRLIDIDPLGHRHLSRFVRDAVAQFEGFVEVQPFCITDRDGESDFIEYSDGQAASHAHAMSAEAKAASQKPLPRFPTRRITSLVDDLALDRIDLMKFDVEGAEEMIIPDLAGVIARYRPKIAISVYHATRHLWEMPCALMSMCDDYDFFFGSYSMTRYESIFYCLPRD